MKMAPSMIAIAMAAMGATAAHAADDIYFGAGVGATHFNGLNKIEGVNVGEEDAAAANAFVGYNFNEYFGSELGYQYTGRGNTDGNRYESQGATLSGIARLPLGNDFSLFGEAGAYWGHTDGLGTSDTKVSPLAGAGVTYKVNDALDLQARYRYMWDVADLHADNGDRYKSNQSVATLEAVYHPFRTSFVAPVAAPVVEEAPAPAPQVVE